MIALRARICSASLTVDTGMNLKARKMLSVAVRRYLELHSYTAERRIHGLYIIFNADGQWLAEIMHTHTPEEVIEIIEGVPDPWEPL